MAIKTRFYELIISFLHKATAGLLILAILLSPLGHSFLLAENHNLSSNSPKIPVTDATAQAKSNLNLKTRISNSDISDDNTQATSLAFNYISPLNSQVNTRTGQLQLTLSPPGLSSFFGPNITPSITYNQNKVSFPHNLLGLPYGWAFSYSYICGNQVFINGQQSYAIDSTWDSGLRYYKLKNVSYDSKTSNFPYDKGKNCLGKLCFQSGENHYFDSNGRLIGIDDRFGNHVLFVYDGEGGIYDSRLKKIINSYAQEICFDYTQKNKIIISYHIDKNRKIQFTYGTNNDGTSLTNYIDPLNNQIDFSYTGGIIKSNLISKIKHSNGQETNYHYITIRSKTQNDFNSLDVINSVEETYQGQNRIITYNYDPKNLQGACPYYTGYPKYIENGNDALIESNDSEFCYSTQVDDGIFITKHTYNFLHLEIVRSIYTQKDLSQPINQIVYSYPGEKASKYFPSIVDLDPNFQYPSCILTTVYNDKGEKRIYKQERKFDDYGKLLSANYYKSGTFENNLALKLETLMEYDNENYGLLKHKDVIDHSSGISKRLLNTFSDDKKSIQTSTIGFLKGDTLNPEKMNTYVYWEDGSIKSQKLEWNDGKEHTPASTKLSKTYNFSENQLTETSTNDQNQTTTIIKNAMMGWVETITDSLGHTVTYTYDDLGRKKTKTDPLGVVKTWDYNDKENTFSTLYVNGYRSQIKYNGFGEPIEFSDKPVENSKERTLIVKTYNEKGQLFTEQGIFEKSHLTYAYNDRGQLYTIKDALGNIKKYEYDPVNRWREEKFNDQLVKTTSFDDNHLPVHEIFLNPFGKETESANIYDNFGKLESFTLGNAESKEHWSKNDQLNYDFENRLLSCNFEGFDNITGKQLATRDLFGNITESDIQVTFPDSKVQNSKSSILNFNALNQLVEENNPLSQKKIYKYDDAGRLQTYTDYGNIDFNYTFYNNNLLHTCTYKDSLGHKCSKEWIYNSQDNTLKSIQDSYNDKIVDSMQYAFYTDGNLKSIKYPDGKEVALCYDELTGALSQFTDALGYVTKYYYYPCGRLYQIVDNDEILTIVYYSKDDSLQSGKIKNITMKNGLQENYLYYPNGSIKNYNVANSTGILLNVDYTYEPTTLNLVQASYSSKITPNDPNVNYTVNYKFNSLNQLTQTSHEAFGKKSTLTYSYDAANNINQITSEVDGTSTKFSYKYDDDNKLTDITTPTGTHKLTYVNGNLTDDGNGHTFTYDEKNQLVTYQDSKKGLKVEYSYYPNGFRKSKKINEGDPIVFYYDCANTPNVVNEVQGNKNTHYLMVGSNRYTRYLNNGKNVKAQEYLSNYKDIVMILDEKGTLQTTYKYEAYGEQDSNTQPSSVDIENNPYQYCKEYTDNESGLIYLRTRFYNPQIKRFMSRDSFRTINRYGYVNGNPVMRTDPTGRLVLIDDLIEIAAVTIIAEETATAAAAAETIAGAAEVAGAEVAAGTAGSAGAVAGGSTLGGAALGGAAAIIVGNVVGAGIDAFIAPSATSSPISSGKARDLFRRSNPGLSGVTSDSQMIRAVQIAYPELGIQDGLLGGGKKNKNNKQQTPQTSPTLRMGIHPHGGSMASTTGASRTINDLVYMLSDRNISAFIPNNYFRNNTTLVNNDRFRLDLQGRSLGGTYGNFAVQNNGQGSHTVAGAHFRLSNDAGRPLSYPWVDLITALNLSVENGWAWQVNWPESDDEKKESL